MNCNKINDDGSGCPRPGKWRPVLQFRVTADGPAAEGELGLQVCDEHKKRVTVHNLLTDEAFQKVAVQFFMARKAMPNKEFTTLVWKPLS